MVACGSLEYKFENPLPNSPTLLEPFSPWNHIKSMKQNLENPFYPEIFSELHFKEKNKNHVLQPSSYASPLPQSSPSSSTSPSSLIPEIHQENSNKRSNEETNNSPDSIASYYPSGKQYRHSDSFTSMNSKSLSLSTEGIGFESSNDVEELKDENNFCVDFLQTCPEKMSENSWKESSKRSRTSKGSFPPTISCIGRTRKPWVCFKSYREDGRFVLQEIRIPTQEFLHACREDGRLRLQFIQSDDKILEEDDGEEDDENGSADYENNICDFGEFRDEENGINDNEKFEHISSSSAEG